MNLKLIDAAITAYTDSLDQKDVARLEAFRAVWEEQQAIAEGLDAVWQPPAADRVRELADAQTPLLREVPAAVDDAPFADAVARIVNVLAQQGMLERGGLSELTKVDWKALTSCTPLEIAGERPADYLEALEKHLPEHGLNHQAARFGALAASLALRPFLESAAQAGTKALKGAEADHFHPLTCPICGSAPSVSRVGGGSAAAKGRHRALWCPQCGAEWSFDRVRCTRCGTHNQGHLHYHHIEGDDAHRIASCDECGGYMRTVFVEEDNFLAPFSFEVEDVVMARLDAVAADPSFAGGAAE